MILIAVNNNESGNSASAKIEDGQVVRIGRNPEAFPDERAGILKIHWKDRLVSRNHCTASREGDQLIIERLPALTGRSNPNALYTNVTPNLRETIEEPIRLSPGDSFVIGAKGSTSLYWLESKNDLPSALEAHYEELEKDKKAFEAADQPSQTYDEVEQLDEYSLRLQLRLLQQELPEQVLSGWTDAEDLFTRAAVFLESALPGQKGVTASFIAVEPKKKKKGVKFEILNPDPLARADFRPSKTLLSELDLKNPSPTDIHIWSSKESRQIFAAESLGEQIDWVAAIPVSLLEESAEVYRDPKGRPVFLYVATRQASETTAAAFIPFLRLICSLVASLLSAWEEQRIQNQMATFFSPGLRQVMRMSDPSLLEPAMVDCTVMFVDRRGHSRMLEVAKTDEQILDRLKENQDVVGLITEEIFSKDGVITDFAGDGALGLWGWPNIGESSQNHPFDALDAAETIVSRLSDHVEYESEVGCNMAAVRIGISTGRLAVGKTGPSQQWHISVFGSVANLGARLERIAKEFRVPTLISDETYQRIKGSGQRRFRKLCFIRPVGFAESYPIHEIILPKKLGGSGASEETVKTYEKALRLFTRRLWDDAITMLETLPVDDNPGQWLLAKALQFKKSPPAEDWEGEIQSLSK